MAPPIQKWQKNTPVIQKRPKVPLLIQMARFGPPADKTGQDFTPQATYTKIDVYPQKVFKWNSP